MATTTWTGASSSAWDLDGNWSGSKPAADDTVIFGAGSAVDCDLDATMQLAAITMTGYTGTLNMSGEILTITGATVLDGTIDDGGDSTGEFICQGAITLTAGMTFAKTAGGVIIDCDNDGAPANITTAAVSNFVLQMNAADTRTQIDEVTCLGFAMTSGTWDANNQGMTLNGTTGLSVTGGTAINNMVMTLDADMDIDSNSYPAYAGEMVIADGRTVTPTARVCVGNLSGAGNIAAGAGYIYMRSYANNGYTLTGANAVALDVENFSSSRTIGAVTLTNADLDLRSFSANRAITATGPISLGTGDLIIASRSASYTHTFDLDAYGLSCGDVVIGYASESTGSGVLALGSGTHSISGDIDDANAVNSQNALALQACYLEIGATLDGDNIDMTDVTADNVVHIQGAGDGTVTNVNTGGKIVHCHNCTDGGSNDAAMTFDEHTPPGSKSLMGIGI